MSSNYREFRNLVETLERMGDKGDLEGREIFIFTDNMVSEAFAARGSSKRKILYELVVRVYKLEMHYKCRIQFIHVAGSRMIAQGSDGLSRGDMYEGVMRGESMLSHVPLHLNAVERSPALLNWIVPWASKFGNEWRTSLQPGGLSAAMISMAVDQTRMEFGCRNTEAALWCGRRLLGLLDESLRSFDSQAQEAEIVPCFVCPRLMWDEWRRHIHKSSDLTF